MAETPAPEPALASNLREAVDVSDPALAKRNAQFGWLLFGLFWLLFGGTVAVAFVYLWLD